MHRLNLQSSRCLLLFKVIRLIRVFLRQRIDDFSHRRIHGFVFGLLLFLLQNSRHRIPHEPTHRPLKLLRVRLPCRFGLQALRVHLGKLLKVKRSVFIRVVVLHQRLRVGHELLVKNVQSKRTEHAHELAALEFAAAIGVKFVERRANGVWVRHRV